MAEGIYTAARSPLAARLRYCGTKVFRAHADPTGHTSNSPERAVMNVSPVAPLGVTFMPLAYRGQVHRVTARRTCFSRQNVRLWGVVRRNALVCPGGRPPAA